MLPSGYCLALLPSNADVIPIVPDNNISDPKIYTTISSSNNIPQSMVALVQVLYASYTLYRTRGDQLNRYGYAAFGLTVIPYIIMSFVNLLGNLLTPGYPTLYLVHSPELVEAQLRGAQIDGVIGKINEVDNSWYTSKKYFIGRIYYHGNVEGLVTLRLEDANQKEQGTTISDIGYHLSYRDSPTGAANTGVLFPGYSRFKTIGSIYQGPRHSGFSRILWWGFMAFFLGAIPYAVIGSLTHFHAAQSTQAQRVLTMFWLASGIFIGATIPFYGFSILEMIDIIRNAFGSKKKFREVETNQERELRGKEIRERIEKDIEERRGRDRELREWMEKEHKERMEKEHRESVKRIEMIERMETETERERMESEKIEVERARKRMEDEMEEMKQMERRREGLVHFTEEEGGDENIKNYLFEQEKRLKRMAGTIKESMEAQEIMKKQLIERIERIERIEKEHEERMEGMEKEHREKIEIIEKEQREKIESETKGMEKEVKERIEKEKEVRERTEKEKGEREENRERASARFRFMFMFLSSLLFCGGAIGGLVIVGQMLKDYGSCILIS